MLATIAGVCPGAVLASRYERELSQLAELNCRATQGDKAASTRIAELMARGSIDDGRPRISGLGQDDVRLVEAVHLLCRT